MKVETANAMQTCDADMRCRHQIHHILQGDENYVSGSSEPGKMAGRIANIETQQQS
jgi:hypothetical protein